MTLVTTVVDPLTGPPPPGWDEFAGAHRLSPGWYSGLLRAVDWCVPVPSSMVTVAERSGGSPLAVFHTRHFGPANPARFVTPGWFPPVSIAECRSAPFPMEAGLAFHADLDPQDRVEAVRAFERGLRRRAGPGGVGIVYRNLLDRDLSVVPVGGRVQRRTRSRMVVRNEWSDVAAYLASLSGKWRSQLRKISDGVSADATVRVELAGTVEPDEACWLAEVVRLRYASGTVPRPPFPMRCVEQLGRLPGSRFLTYRDPGGRLLGYSAVYDNGTDLHLIWWGGRGDTDGRRDNLYFDQYLRLIELMIDLGRRRLVLGAGMERIKARYGARPEPRWVVLGATVATVGRSARRRPAASPPQDHAPERASAAAPDPARAPAPAPDPRRRAPLRRVLARVARRWPTARPAAPCRQCGGSSSVNLLRVGRRHARYWCQRCGAVFELVAAAAAVAAQDAGASHHPEACHHPGYSHHPGVPEGPGPAANLDPAWREVMPAAMTRWAASRARGALRAGRLDRATVYQLYRGWDAHLRELGPEGAAALAEPGEPPACPGLPAFSTVVGALHDGCYHVDSVVERLRDTGTPPGAEPALRQRVEHARRWLARHGMALCWVHARQPDGGLAEPDRAGVEAAVAALAAGRWPEPVAGRAARAALFGTDGGPSLATLAHTYSIEDMVVALRSYLASGARPLREQTLARLSVRSLAPPAD
jgi:hypothetical protein